MDTKNKAGRGGLSHLFQSALSTEINRATNKNSNIVQVKPEKNVISNDLSKNNEDK